MSSYVNNLNNTPHVLNQINFEAKHKSAVPMSNAIDDIANKIDEEKEKKQNKYALTIGGVVTSAVLAVALLNPRYSKKLAEKLQKGQLLLSEKINKTKKSVFVNKIYKVSSSIVEGASNFVNFINNVNPLKDIWFKNLCMEPKTFDNIKSLRVRKIFQKISQKIVNVTSKIHNGITKMYENIGRYTVKHNYKKSAKDLDRLENFIKQNLNKLSKEERAEVELKLAEISKVRWYFTEKNVNARLYRQEECMQNLERDFMSKLRKYGADYSNKWIRKRIRKGDLKELYYWPEEILSSSKDKIVKKGSSVTAKLLNENPAQKGLYNEIGDIISRRLNSEDKKYLEEIIKKSEKTIKTASNKEYVEYFDKIRDLKLGSAPTDIVTAAIFLSLSGAAIASADDKKRRMSRLVTGVIPAVSGVGVSLGMAAGLVSGAKSLVYGLLATLVLNRIGIFIDKHALDNKEYYESNRLKNKKAVKTAEGEGK